MHYFLLIYFNNKPLHVSDKLCINSISYRHALCWLVHDYTNCCLYRVDPPDDEQQAWSKHVEAYYWNKLIENIASCWFILYGYCKDVYRVIIDYISGDLWK